MTQHPSTRAQDRIDHCVLCVIDVLTVIVTLIIVLIIAGLLIFPAYAGECLGSAQAVWDAHPSSHATWNLIDGRECWRVGWGKRSKEVVHSAEASRSSRHDTTPRPP